MDDKERERIQAWVDRRKDLEKRAVKVSEEIRDKEHEYYEILEKMADCGMAIREGREPSEREQSE